MWTVDVVTETQGFESLRAEWTQLVDRCPTSTVFQSFEWLATWWRELGRRALGTSLFIVLVRDEGGTLTGLAPLMVSPWRFCPLLKRLSFMGAGVSDYHDFLALPNCGQQVCSEVYRYLANCRRWHVADFSQLRDGGLLRANRPGAGAGLAFLDFVLERCPYLPYPPAAGDSDCEARWQTLTKGYGKKMRAHIGYYERKLKALYVVETGYVQDPDNVDEAMDALFELHRRRWNKRWLPGVLAGDAIQRFHRGIAREFLDRGWLRLHYILLDEEYQALLYCFAFHDRTCYYQGGFEPTLARFSLGSVLTAKAIRQSLCEDKSEFDFLRGDEPYKERWTQGHARANVRRLLARTGSPLLAAARFEFRIENSIEMRFKDFMHHAYSKESQQKPADEGAEGKTDR